MLNRVKNLSFKLRHYDTSFVVFDGAGTIAHRLSSAPSAQNNHLSGTSMKSRSSLMLLCTLPFDHPAWIAPKRKSKIQPSIVHPFFIAFVMTVSKGRPRESAKKNTGY